MTVSVQYLDWRVDNLTGYAGNITNFSVETPFLQFIEGQESRTAKGTV